MKMNWLIGSGVAAGLLATGMAQGATWTGASSSDWGDSGNWSGGEVPADDDAVLFDATASSTGVNVNGARSAGQMTVSGATYSPSGDALTVSSLVLTDGANVIFNNDLAFSGNATVTLERGTGLSTMAGLASATEVLTVSATGSGSSLAVFSLDGGGTFTDVSLGSGTRLSVDLQSMTASNSLAVNGELFLETGGNETFAGALSGSGAIYVDGLTTANFNGGTTFTGTLSVDFASEVSFGASTAAELGSSTSLNDGSLVSDNGFVLASGRTLSGLGTVSNDNSAATAFTNSGTIDGTGSGTADELEFTGYVTGSGTFTGDVAFGGTYAPGNSPGTVNLENFRLSSTSALVIDLAGTTQGVTYDFLDISGTATLEGGTLSVVLLDGFVPGYGDTFTFMEADGGIIGDFGTFDLPALSEGLSWSVSNDGTFYTLTAVPEPAGMGFAIGLGLAALVFVRRRNRRRAAL